MRLRFMTATFLTEGSEVSILCDSDDRATERHPRTESLARRGTMTCQLPFPPQQTVLDLQVFTFSRTDTGVPADWPRDLSVRCEHKDGAIHLRNCSRRQEIVGTQPTCGTEQQWIAEHPDHQCGRAPEAD